MDDAQGVKKRGNKRKERSTLSLVTDSDCDIFNDDGTVISGSVSRLMSFADGCSDGEEWPDILKVYQARWLQAALADRVNIRLGTRQEVHRAIKDRWSDRTLKQLIEKIFKKYKPEKRMPRPKTDRVNALFDIAKGFRISDWGGRAAC
jgi:hypothetical protein